jgi:hypothetical protein
MTTPPTGAAVAARPLGRMMPADISYRALLAFMGSEETGSCRDQAEMPLYGYE